MPKGEVAYILQMTTFDLGVLPKVEVAYILQVITFDLA